MKKKVLITLSIPDDFLEKFVGFLNNVNMINNSLDPPIIIESIIEKDTEMDDYAAVPKNPQ